MSLCLVGPQRSGKSTLAKAIAEQTGMTYVPSQAGELFKEMGFAVDQPLTFEERMSLQETVLDVHLAQLSTAGTYFIADRSSLDMAAYTMAEWGKNAPLDQEKRLLDYVERCYAVAGQHYSGVVLIQPGIEYVVEEGKPRPSLAFQETINTLLYAMMHDARVGCPRFMMQRWVVDLEERMARVMMVWNCIVSRAAEMISANAVH
jgi:nicotinamide riboside kinase